MKRNKVHNFVPFNSFAQTVKFPWNKECECSSMFAPEEKVLEGFLDIHKVKKPGFWARAKFLLPTGCIQEVHVAQRESAFEAFHRWKKQAKMLCLDHVRVDGEFCLKCNPASVQYCKKFCTLAYLAGMLPGPAVNVV